MIWTWLIGLRNVSPWGDLSQHRLHTCRYEDLCM